MIPNPYARAEFLKSAAKLEHLPEDIGFEVAFVGRSNAGKSSALNTLTTQKQLARISKTPGRTQLINLFSLDDQRRLVDLPGYGYAKVAHATKEAWQASLAKYLEKRQCLRGLVLLVDCRHDLKPLDESMLRFALERELPVHILLTKADKLAKGPVKDIVKNCRNRFSPFSNFVTVQSFSSHNKHGLEELIARLNQWFAYDEQDDLP